MYLAIVTAIIIAGVFYYQNKKNKSKSLKSGATTRVEVSQDENKEGSSPTNELKREE